MTSVTKKQSNPFSTGSGGATFEVRIQALFLLLMLTYGRIPSLSSAYKIQKIKLQGKYEGYDTDDLILNAADESKTNANFYGQIKHEISIGDGGETVFAEVIQSAWNDFNSQSFDRRNDVIALITGPLSNTDTQNVRPLLEWARHCENSEEFLKKTGTEGFSSKVKTRKLEAFRVQLKRANDDQNISDDDFWQFLRCFHLIGYDIDSENSPTEKFIESLLELHCTEQPQLVWARLIAHIQSVNQNAGTIRIGDIPPDILDVFKKDSLDLVNKELKIFSDRCRIVPEAIQDSVSGIHIHRSEYLLLLSDIVAKSNFVFVTGERGAGKSSLVKEYSESLEGNSPVYYLRAEDFDKPNLNDVFNSMGIHIPFSNIESAFSLVPHKYLIIESLEKILELGCDRAFVDLLQMLHRQTGWNIIATGRSYAYQQLSFNYLQPAGISTETLTLEGFNDEELDLIVAQFPGLKNLHENSELLPLLRIPFYTEIAVRVIEQGGDFQPGDDEKVFRAKVWRYVIANEGDRRGGMPLKRKQTFIDIAKIRAKKMLYSIPESGFDPETLIKLENDDLVIRDQEKSLVCPAHDVLEDWALEEFIQQEHSNNTGQVENFLSAIGDEPAINRAFRLWLYQRLINDEDVSEFISSILLSVSIPSYWQDEVISAILQGPTPEGSLELLGNELIQDDCQLLLRFFFILRITCQRPNPLFTKSAGRHSKELADSLFLVPFGNGWDAIIKFLHNHLEQLPDSLSGHFIELVHEWSNIVSIYTPLPKISKEVGLLALKFLEPLKNTYRNQEAVKKIIPVIVKVASSIDHEFNNLLDKDIFSAKRRRDRPSYADIFTELIFQGAEAAFLSHSHPDLIIQLAFHEWFKEPPDQEDPFFDNYGIDIDDMYGLEREHYFFPASGIKGPFAHLLLYHPRKGLDFIIELCNKAAENFGHSEYAISDQEDAKNFPLDEMAVGKISLELNDGTIIDQYASPHLWKGYRGLSTVPYSLQSALMALENWLIEYIQQDSINGKQINWLYDYIIRNSNSVLTTSVLASVATGHSHIVERAGLPLLRTPELYSLDLQRSVGEMGRSEPNWFATMHNQDPMADFHVEDRRKAALRKWRKEPLEWLLIQLQLNQNVKDETLKVVDLLAEKSKSMADNESIRFLLHRSDTRHWQPNEDEENNRIYFETDRELDLDLQESQERFNETHKDDNEVSKLSIWAGKFFDPNSETDTSGYYSSYAEALNSAIELAQKLENNELHGFPELAVGAIARTATACLKEHAAELSQEQAVWCIDTVTRMAVLQADNYSFISRDVSDFHGEAACASVLPILFDFVEEDGKKILLKQVIAIALTHANTNVQAQTASGVREHLWKRDPEFAQQCLYAAIEYGKFVKKNVGKRRLLHSGQDDVREKAESDWSKLLQSYRNDIVEGKFSSPEGSITLNTHSTRYIHLPFLMIPFGSNDPEHLELISNIVNLVFDDEFNGYNSNQDENLQPEILKSVQHAFVEHLYADVNCDFEHYIKLLLDGCRRAPGVVYYLKLSFSVTAEQRNNIKYFWRLWELLSPAVAGLIELSTAAHYRGRNHEGRKLIRGFLFADTPWKKNEYEAEYIAQGKELITEFVKKVGYNKDVVEAFSSLMFYFPAIFLTDGLLIIADFFRNDKSGELLSRSNTSFYLERAIQYFLQIEQSGALERKIYDACLVLLTATIGMASARAYYLREHLIRTRRKVNS